MNNSSKSSIKIEKIEIKQYDYLRDLIADLVSKLNETVEVANKLKAENEVLKSKLDVKVDSKDIDKTLSKIRKSVENIDYNTSFCSKDFWK